MAPFAYVVFCPTGGVQPGNARELRALPNVACAGGSWPAPVLQQGDWQGITALARESHSLHGRG